MSETSKIFAGATFFCFGLGLSAKIVSFILEHQARQELSPEMRTPEAIQYHYDGAVCLGCDIAGIGLMILFFALGVFIAVVWGIYEAFSNNKSLN